MRRVGIIAVLAFALAAAPAGAADELLDTITVDPASTSVVTGKVALKAGTRYVVEVTGTMQSTGPEGYGFKYDALYCYAGVNFDHEECEDERRDPNNHTLRSSNPLIGAGPGEDWRLADQFTTTSKPAGDVPAVDYDPNHSYTVGFYPPADGPIRGAGAFALHPCGPGCQNTTTGSFTVKVFGQAATPAPAPSPSPQPTQPTACASAAGILAHASVCPPFGWGTWANLSVPAPGKPVKVDIGIPPDVKQIFLDAGIEDAETQQLIAALAIKAREKRFEDELYGCMYFMGASPADFVPIVGSNGTVWSALMTACMSVLAKGGISSVKPIALTSQAGCNVLFFPARKKGQRKPSAAKRRSIGRTARKAFRGGCAQENGRLSLTLKSNVKGVRLSKLTSSTAHVRLARIAPANAANGPQARLYVRWRKP